MAYGFKKVWILLKQTIIEMSEDKVPKQAAALSFYTVFAIGPLMLIFLKLLGIVWEREELQRQIIIQFRALIGSQGAEAIETITEKLKENPDYLKWQAINAWNGELPLSTGSAFPFIDISLLNPDRLNSSNANSTNAN